MRMDIYALQSMHGKIYPGKAAPGKVTPCKVYPGKTAPGKVLIYRHYTRLAGEMEYPDGTYVKTHVEICLYT